MKNDGQKNVKIANVSLAFKNFKIINLLKQRGNLLGNGKLNEIYKIDE